MKRRDTMERTITYFDTDGHQNTDRTIELAVAYCRDYGIRKIVVASSSGATALKLKDKAGDDLTVIAVTYGAGSRFVEEVEAFNKNYETLRSRNILTVRGIHALSGVERALENRYKTGFMPLNIVADTLRLFSQGMKVCVEVAIMAAEAGFITPKEDVVVLGGSGEGADTAVLMKPGYAATLFDIKIREILCMPRS
ncbi:MAG: hypothetical protein N3B18_07355 [Desulfobacterota bacterium]|nr:hypothetical protein [Thermodesulfobacteriota bacterium]